MNKFKVTLNVDDGNEFTAIFNDEKEADKFIECWKQTSDTRIIAIFKEVE